MHVPDCRRAAEGDISSTAAKVVEARQRPKYLVAGRKVFGMINRNTTMSTSKVAVTIDRRLLERLDALVKKRAFPNRSKAIQLAVQEQIARLDHSRLARECAKLDSRAEQAMADQGLERDHDQWPEY